MTNAEAIETLRANYPDACYEQLREAVDKAIKALEAQEWVPVSERLPDKPNVYTVADHKGDVVRYVYYDNESSKEYWKRCAKAWKPLPEPYREEVKHE